MNNVKLDYIVWNYDDISQSITKILPKVSSLLDILNMLLLWKKKKLQSNSGGVKYKKVKTQT